MPRDPAKHRFSLTRFIASAGLLGLGVAAILLGFQVVKADVAAKAYKRQIQQVAQDYESLRETYNDAVRRSAVTELLVQNNQLSVQVRNAEGVLTTLDTPFDPSLEIFVDYVVIDGRLWIRRIFDEHTAPSKAIVIDPKVANVDWSAESARHGKVVYRALDEGRWIIDVTADGSLGLRRAIPGEDLPLIAPPEIKEHPTIDQQIEQSMRQITLADIWQAIVGTE